MDLPYVPVIPLKKTRGLYHDDGTLIPAYDRYLARMKELTSWKSMDYLTLTNLMITTLNEYLSVFTRHTGTCWIEFFRPSHLSDRDKYSFHLDLVLKFFRDAGWEVEVHDIDKSDLVHLCFIDREIADLDVFFPYPFRTSSRKKFTPGSDGSGIGC